MKNVITPNLFVGEVSPQLFHRFESFVCSTIATKLLKKAGLPVESQTDRLCRIIFSARPSKTAIRFYLHHYEERNRFTGVVQKRTRFSTAVRGANFPLYQTFREWANRALDLKLGEVRKVYARIELV